MKHILAKTSQLLLQQFAWSSVLLGFDFDGTLAPIVREPGAATMRASTREALKKLAKHYPCAVISGRGRADVTRRLDGIPLLEVVGNHGLEPSVEAERFARQVQQWAPALEAELGDVGGIEIENKGPSVAVHYRKSRTRREAKQRIERALHALDGAMRIIPGKLVVNILPVEAPHKGVAVQRLREEAGADTAIYIGDDVTDEDVFALDEPGRLLSIRVGRNLRSHATYYLHSQIEIDALINRLIELRAKS